jgi:hypothetical protein
MMKRLFRNVPGWAGTLIVTTLNAIWLYWGLGEAFYEGWGVPETPWFLFLSIAAAAMAFSALAIRFPLVGGGLLAAAGLAFALWWLLPGIQNGFFTLNVVIGRLVLSAGFTLVGVLFILDGKLNPRQPDPQQPWWQQNLRMLTALGIPLLVGIGVAGVNLPMVLTRVDDGNRSARKIEGNGVTLIWAPSGPGWNWQQDFGGYPSWDALAAYGIEPVGLDTGKLSGHPAAETDMTATGLCVYLDASGTQLMSEPQHLWRMPTVDEIARSLSLHNENAGCTWEGGTGKLPCESRSDKETPLWAPDEPPVYYWSAEAHDDENAYFVSYTGYVSFQPKNWGNPRHGYRCVREP